MKQSFMYQDLTIEVRATRGLDLIDNPALNGHVLEHLTGSRDASECEDILWGRLATYVTLLQVSTVKGKGLSLPSVTDPKDAIGKGYDGWAEYIDEHPECYRKWNAAYKEVNKEVVDTDPQAESAEGNSESK